MHISDAVVGIVGDRSECGAIEFLFGQAVVLIVFITLGTERTGAAGEFAVFVVGIGRLLAFCIGVFECAAKQVVLHTDGAGAVRGGRNERIAVCGVVIRDGARRATADSWDAGGEHPPTGIVGRTCPRVGVVPSRYYFTRMIVDRLTDTWGLWAIAVWVGFYCEGAENSSLVPYSYL